MAFDPLLGLGSMIGNVAGGFITSQGAKDINERNIQETKDTNAENWAHSLYMANNSVKLRAMDARDAGINPLYALGAPTMSFAPSQVGTSSLNTKAPVGQSMANLGQDVTRAAAAMSSPVEKVNGMMQAQQLASNRLDIEAKEINNTILKSRLATMTQPGTPPGVRFDVPENKKIEERPPLMLLGRRWDTNPNTSPMKAWEDQYGDEGPVASMLPIGIFANDFAYNMRDYGKIPDDKLWYNLPAAARRWWSKAKSDFQMDYRAPPRGY